ncbi:MAG: fatty acid desaturase [Woeseiaceae bacterium]|nr:fatty acid desaturase [Woeseiaceae bacterium]
MEDSREADAQTYPVPGRLNVALLLASGVGATACLWLASHAESWFVIGMAAVTFSFVNNTVFSLLHEATHGILHASRRANDWLGRLAAAFFPTSYSMQRAFHLTHHKHNRSEFEQFDYLRPGDNRFLKYAQWYSILTGVYWIFPPLFCIAYSVAPATFRVRWLASTDTTVGHQTGSAVYLGSLRNVPVGTIRLEVLSVVLLQAGLFWVLGLNAVGWALCYAAFAVNWSALQYADHAWSPLDRKNGAWNLKVNPLTKKLFLNYHDHLAHHRHPKVPWIYLPALVDADEHRPSFLTVWLSMWRGPRPIAEAPADSVATHG